MARRRVWEFTCHKCGKQELIEVDGGTPRGWTFVVQMPLETPEMGALDPRKELCDGCSHEVARFIEPKDKPDVRLRAPQVQEMPAGMREIAT